MFYQIIQPPPPNTHYQPSYNYLRVILKFLSVENFFSAPGRQSIITRIFEKEISLVELKSLYLNVFILRYLTQEDFFLRVLFLPKALIFLRACLFSNFSKNAIFILKFYFCNNIYFGISSFLVPSTFLTRMLK